MMRCRPRLEGHTGKGRDRVVYRRKDGETVNERLDAERAGSVRDTQRAAEQAARRMPHDSGGRELITKCEDGRIRTLHTTPPGHDLDQPKDREH